MFVNYDVLDEQIEIECQKTANVLMFALENRIPFGCKMFIESERIRMIVQIKQGNPNFKNDHSWEIALKNLKPAQIDDISEMIANLIFEYTDQCFVAVKITQTTMVFKMTEKGMNTVHNNLIDRSKAFMNRLLKNVDVKNWCNNRIFFNGFPNSIMIDSRSISVDGRVSVIFSYEDYNDLASDEELYGMGQCLAKYGKDKYTLKLLDNKSIHCVLLTYNESKRVRKQW